MLTEFPKLNGDVNDIEWRDVVLAICEQTSLYHASSERQLKNGTLMFYDHHLDELYAIYLPTGYVRRGIRSMYGPYPFNPQKRVSAHLLNGYGSYNFYQLNPKYSKPIMREYRWRDMHGQLRIHSALTHNARKVFPNDFRRMVEILLSSYEYRHAVNGLPGLRVPSYEV